MSNGVELSCAQKCFDNCGSIEMTTRFHPERMPKGFLEPDALQVLGALGQPTRLAVFRHLVRHEPSGDCPGEMAAALDLSPATLSFHLKALQAAGLLVSQARGRHIVYRAELGAVGSLVGYLVENCCAAGLSSCVPFAGAKVQGVEQ